MPRHSALEYALLGLLQQEPRSGYDLRRIFSATPFAHFSDSPGAIYPALRRLAARGLIAGGVASGGRRRRTFRPTTAGGRAWLAWLQLPPTRAEVVWEPDSLMLRFAFMGDALPASAAVRFLAVYQKETEAHVAALRRFQRDTQANVSRTGRLAFQAGVAMFLTRIAWARRARKALARKGEA
jgi:DNA-binding PadR family transcriptional regulator